MGEDLTNICPEQLPHHRIFRIAVQVVTINIEMSDRREVEQEVPLGVDTATLLTEICLTKCSRIANSNNMELDPLEHLE